ncbi:hypothetical protein HO173_012077 [Letharia columbiana]|uniref:Uncharacterized protein n=1 Tax=Letharia columbiana TaxID=112416 RepID=A0A8H6CQA3_9LECA|nr:uncharacterized protein HO173_012077 [Letharia columbiana]KAF6227637.1 hypothetical protein HO173_012077 [Letharia columbiana]
MKQEPVWKVGPVMESIYSTLQQILRLVEKSPKIYLDDAFLSEISVRKHEWDLADTDDFFACMTEEELAHLRPSDPIPDEAIPYEDVEYPESAQPQNVFDLESSGVRIEEWFHELQKRKVSIDGCGCIWPEGSSSWAPRELFKYEYLSRGRRNPPHVPWTLSGAYYNDDQPHQIYHAWHGDEGREGIILRSELQILIRCMKGRMADPALCIHNVPVLLLSIHGTKARIMIAHFNMKRKTLDIKCSGFEQFDGFEAKENTGTTDGCARPHDFEAKRDLFFRWLNPICQGDTYLKDSEDAPEMVLRGPKGRKRLVPRHLPPPSSSSESTEILE